MTRARAQAYLDNNATTPVAPEVWAAMLPYFSRIFGNPSSLHAWGGDAAVAVEEARSRIVSALRAHDFNIIFTGSGTEADNLAIWGTSLSRGRHIVTTAIEHPAVLRQCVALEPFGINTTYVKPNARLTVDGGDVAAAVTGSTSVVSVMHVNNELGSILPVRDIALSAKHRNPAVLVHVDAVQSIGKLEIPLEAIDLVSLSAHKIHGPKGIGALLVRRGIELRPQLVGGPHERGCRAGTLNVPSIVGFGHAVEIAVQKRQNAWASLTRLKDTFVAALQSIKGVIVNSPPDAAPSTLSVAFPNISGPSMVQRLSQHGIAASAGAACAGAETSRSHVLTAVGVPAHVIDRTVRFSFSRDTTSEEIDRAINAIRTILEE